MGYDRHHAIIVTCYSLERIQAAYIEAVKLFEPQKKGVVVLPWSDHYWAGAKCVSQIVRAPINDWFTFFIGPDGSKESWDESDIGDQKRAELIRWLDTQRFEDGSSPYDWVEVQYGDDERVTRVTAHSDEEARRNPGALK